MALKEIRPGNEVYTSIILRVGGKGAANRNCHRRNSCRQSLEHKRKKTKSPFEKKEQTNKPKCAKNIVQWQDWWMLIEMNSINSYYILYYFRKFSWQSRKVEGDAGKLSLWCLIPPHPPLPRLALITPLSLKWSSLIQTNFLFSCIVWNGDA